MTTQTECVCENPNCRISFLRYASEVRRSEKLGRRLFCSMSCSGEVNKIHLPKNPPTEHLKNVIRTDKYTGLREHLRRVKSRTKEKGSTYNITLDDLLRQWKIQKGVCPYTGIKLIHPKQRGKKPKMFDVASLDRIDSSKGYVKGNIQFVSTCANLAKSKMSHEEMIEFCKEIGRFWKDEL